MYVKRQIVLKHLFHDSWRLLLIVAIWSVFVVYLHEFAGLSVITIPLAPVTTIGIAVSLYLGFKSTSAYNRWWEARKVWGEIVSASRLWASHSNNLLYNPNKNLDPAIPRELVARHLAWVNALAHQLRSTTRLKDSQFTRIFDHRLKNKNVDHHQTANSYKQFLSPDEVDEMSSYSTPATQILIKQGFRVRELFADGFLDSDRVVLMTTVLGKLHDAQSNSERIKTTPFPRQVANFGELFTWIFIFMLPLAFIESFEVETTVHNFSDILAHQYMFTLVPFTMLIAWVFFIMEKISDSTEDPFEGGVTDVAISSLCRTIEIDLKEMIKATDIPEEFRAVDGVLY
jgi:putative membrane protein